MNFETFNTFIQQPQTKIIDDLGLPPCQAAIEILQHLEAIKQLLNSDN